MSQWVDQLKGNIPDYAKDIRLNIDAVIKRSSLSQDEAEYVALAAAFATGNHKLWTWIQSQLNNSQEALAAITAASLMAQNNIYYPYTEMVNNAFTGMPANLRMNAISEHGGTTKEKFEAYSLAASIVGKCNFCVQAHFNTLKTSGYTLNQLQDIGRIASIIVAVSKIMN